MLSTPVELLRNAPEDGEPVPHGERVERRLGQRATLVLLFVLALAALAAAFWR